MNIGFTALTLLGGTMNENRFAYLQEFESCYDAMLPAKEKSDELFVWITGAAHPILNNVMHFCSNDVERKVDRLLGQIGKDIPLSFWVHSENRAPGLEEILHTRGFQSILTCPLMVWTVEKTDFPKYEVRLADDMVVFNEILAIGSELSEELKNQFAALLAGIDCENYIVYDEGKPVGVGTLFPRGRFGGVFNEAVLPEFQRRGYGEAVMRHIMNRAHELGLDHLILLSSPDAVKLYTKLGFQTITEIEIYARL